MVGCVQVHLGDRFHRRLRRALPITSLGTFALMMGICYHFYDDRRPGRPLQSVSSYAVGPWNPEYGPALPNLSIFRTGVGVLLPQMAFVLGGRHVLLRAASPKPRSASSCNAYRMLLLASLGFAFLSGVSLCGVAAVTYYDNGPHHYGYAAACYFFLLVSQFLESVAIGCVVRPGRGSRRPGLLLLGWGGACIVGAASCLVAHVVVYHPPLQWAGSVLGLAYYLTDSADLLARLASASEARMHDFACNSM